MTTVTTEYRVLYGINLFRKHVLYDPSRVSACATEVQFESTLIAQLHYR